MPFGTRGPAVGNNGGVMSGVDSALGRVAVVVRLIGALWIVALVVAAAAAGQLAAPAASWTVTGLGVAWALVAWRWGWIAGGSAAGPWVVGVDVLVSVLVIAGPGAMGETATFSGGYPFAALAVALAVAGRRGVVAVAFVLSLATLANLFSVGSPSLTFVTSNVLLYALGAAALVLGVDVLRRQEARARVAESALAVERERAATAAHLHDSVLQTLALVQRRADDAGQVRSLARRQERELREWLFPSSPVVSGGARLADLLAAHAEDVQRVHDVAVRPVTVGRVGDLVVVEDSALASLVMAAREAVVNAAVHAGVGSVDVYAERDTGGVAVFVRDRGDGFDLDAVPADRHGVRRSIIDRMARAGGTAVVRSTVGGGTEVQLRLPEDALEAT